MHGLPQEATARSNTGILGVSHYPLRSRPWKAKLGRKDLGWYATKEAAEWSRLHAEMHKYGISPERAPLYRLHGFSEELIEKYSICPSYHS